MQDFVASGRVADAILAIMAVEFVVLTVFYMRTGRGVAPRDLLFMLFAGAALVLALRAALTGAGWHYLAGCLALALVAHLADLSRRWR
jgi:hypothetical protein